MSYRRVLRTVLCLPLLTPVLFAQVSPSPPPPHTMTQLRDAWVHALEQQDLEASIALYDAGAVFLTPEGGRYEDRPAIRALYQGVFTMYRGHITMTSRREESSNALAVDQGVYDESLTDVKTGAVIKLTGSYLLVAKRLPDGSLKITDIMWTATPPAAN